MEVKQLNGDGQGTHTWVGGPLAIRPLPPLRKGVESREAWVDTLEPAARPFQPFSACHQQLKQPPPTTFDSLRQDEDDPRPK